MKLPEKFREYIWLVHTISRSRNGLSLSEINEHWVQTDMSGGVPFARNTFLRHKNAIEEMFGLFIECNARNGYRYYIGNEHVLQQDSVQNWLLSTLTVSNIVSESLSLQHRILLENVVAGSQHLELILQAMKQCRRLRLHYRRYQGDGERQYDVAPYCLKLFRQRWYLLGRFADDRYAVFALDRVQRLLLLDSRFTIDPYFDADDFFSESYGVVIGDGSQPQRIVLRAYGREQYAMADLPLHHTQRLLAQTADHTDFELTLRPTADFKAYLLSRGRWIRVLHPDTLAAEVEQLLREAAEQYARQP